LKYLFETSLACTALADNVGMTKWRDLLFPQVAERPNGTIYCFRRLRNDQMARFTVSAGCGTTKWSDLLFPQVAERPNDAIHCLSQSRNNS
jgi:hypothetical protein